LIEVRGCGTHAEYAACVRLQAETWGARYRDVVTASLLKVSRRVGGVVAGAFLPSDRMVGFVFGLTGVDGGRLVHWSHMMAVHPAYRDQGVGRRLKAHQWRVLREMGVERAYWTFDPLVARNAHFNLTRLGVRFEEYVAEMYADTGSGLHAFGTDRFVVSWPVVEGDPLTRAGVPELETATPVVNVDGAGRPVMVVDTARESRVRVAIPSDIEGMIATDLPGLEVWRRSTRSAFERYLASGYGVGGFVRGTEAGWYVLERGSGDA
jgi:predicted GNAT superfamily acetyltransferase